METLKAANTAEYDHVVGRHDPRARGRGGIGERGAEPGAFYMFPGDPVANGVGLANAGRRPV